MWRKKNAVSGFVYISRLLSHIQEKNVFCFEKLMLLHAIFSSSINLLFGSIHVQQLHISETKSETESSACSWVIFMHTGRKPFCCCVYMRMTFWRYTLHSGSNRFINIRTRLVASNNHTVIPVFGTVNVSINFCC